MELETNYKLDILEKAGEAYCLLYFVFGFFVSYSWACKELDFHSDPREINSFWDSIAMGFGLLNMFNTGIIIFTNIYNRKHSKYFRYIPNESNILFYILCFPLFIATIIYLVLEVVWSINASYSLKYTTTGFSIFSTIMEIFLYCFTIILIISQMNQVLKPQNNDRLKNLNRFVVVLSGTGIFAFFSLHITSQQVHNFVNVSSNYQSYEKYFDNITIANRTYNYPKNSNIRNYMLPLVILFCCSCMSYLITIFYRNNNFSGEIATEFFEVASHRGSENEFLQSSFNPGYQADNDPNSNDDVNVIIAPTNDTITKSKAGPSFRLPPMSLVVGILFITLTILLLIITDSFLSDLSENMKTRGLMIYAIFPIPVYLISFLLLFMQLHEMSKWPRLQKIENPQNEDKNKEEEDDLNHGIVDKTLIWIGAGGQLIVSLALLKSLAYLMEHDTEKNNSTFYVLSVIEYSCLMVHTILQSIVLSLAMDRDWKEPVAYSWYEKVCPSVGLLSINLGFFFFSIYAVRVGEYSSFLHIPNPPLFLKIFGNGFHTLGETLAILHRLHGALLFGRMAVITNH